MFYQLNPINFFTKFIYGFIIIIFSFSVNANDTTRLLHEIEEDIALMQSNSPKCENLHDIHCVKEKINYCYKLDEHVRNKSIKMLDNIKFLQLIEKIDLSNTNEIKEILKLHGWTTISKFGAETDRQAWLLVQHADQDLFFQAGIAFLLEKLVFLGETDPKNFAYLYDRVVVKFQDFGLKQKYGTQADLKGKTIIIKPFEGTLEELNLRRKKIGLNSMDEYQKQLNEMYN